MADGARGCLIERPSPVIRGHINLYGCTEVGNRICDGSVSHTLHHLSVCLPVCHTDMSLLRGESAAESRLGGLGVPELLIT